MRGNLLSLGLLPVYAVGALGAERSISHRIYLLIERVGF